MEDCQILEEMNDNPSSSVTIDHEVNAVNVVMDENIALQEKCELSPGDNNIVLTDNFQVHLFSRDTTDNVANPEENVLISMENKVTKNVVADSCVEKDKTQIECEVTLAQHQSNNVSISNLVTSDDKLEIVTNENNVPITETEIQKSVGDIVLSENVNTEIKKSMNGVFSENSALNNPKCISSNSELETEVRKSLEGNMESSPDVVEIDSDIPIQEDCLLVFNSNDNSLINNSEVEIVKEVSVQETPKSNIENEQTLTQTFSQSKYRCEKSDIWTDDDDDSTSDSSSSDSDFFQDMCEKVMTKKLPLVKTKGEIGLDELPPIEDLVISIDESNITAIGKIYAVVEKLVVIRSLKGMKALDLDSVLFLSHDQPLGRVFDVFGPVNEPFYSVRFNSVEQINEKGVDIGAEVFFAPEKSDFTTYVFVEELQNQKGSDASWKHNNEPPEEFLDYSDDEQEKYAKKQRRNKNRNQQIFNNHDSPAKRPLMAENSSNYIPPPKPAPQWNRSQNIPHRISRPNPFQSHYVPRGRSPSVLMSPIRMPNSFGSSPNQPQRLAQPRNILYRPSPQLFVSPYQQPHHVFGQLAVVNHLSPAMRAPSPLPSPVMNNMPALIPATHFSAPQNYFTQSFTNSSPLMHNQRMTPDPWLPNRSPNSANLPPSHPLTVQIPNMGSSSLPMHPFAGERGSVQQFVNIQNGNYNEPPFVNNNRNFHPVNMQPRFYRN